MADSGLARALGIQKPDPKGAPSHTELMLTVALYAPHAIDEEWGDYLHRLWYGAIQFDAYCVNCRQSATFRALARETSPTREQALKPGRYERTLYCTRHGHEYAFYFALNATLADGKIKSALTKIGQMPSIQDIAGGELQQFKSILDDEDFRELNKATGLFSHGIGIGSFVYLRRIFERMINRHREEFEKTNGTIEKWSSKRMDEKIEALRTSLPPALVTNKSTYGILSKGIHELTEDQCKLYFPVVRAAIVLMLQQALEARVRRQREQDLQNEISRISGELSGAKQTS